MTTYTSEAYSAANGLSILWTYEFSDGEIWTKLDEEYIAADMNVRRRTRVWKQEFAGDTSRRSTLKALTAKTSTAACTGHTVINGAKAMADTAPVDGGYVPAPNAKAREAALTEAEAEQAEAAAPAILTYEKTTKWAGSDPEEDLHTNVYTYAFNDGVTYVQREHRNIVTGGFTTTVRRTGPDGVEVRTTLRDLTEHVEQAEAEAKAIREAEAAAQRAKDAPKPLPRPAYRIERGFEEAELPMTARQVAVVTALHRELGLRYPLEVLPPVKGNDVLTASGDEVSGRFLIDVDPEGYVERVAVRYDVAGFVGWADLPVNSPDSSDSDLRLRVAEIARAARLATPVLTTGTNAAD